MLLNITEPSTPAEIGKGYFFAICEINNAETKYISKVQKIIDDIENNYYEMPDQTEQTAMEIVLDKVNQENLSMVQPDISLHCIVGAIRENEIIFSFYGNPQMVLFYKTKDGLYKKMDLVDQNKSNEQGGKNQLFSQIVQGKISQNDFFFAGTPHIIDYFNHDRLQKIITTRPPRQSSEHLQRVLSEIKNNLSFGGIIINLQHSAELSAPTKSSPARKGGAGRSLKNLFSAEQNTAQILSPSLLPRFQDKLDSADNTEEPESEMMGSAKINIRANTDTNSSHWRARIAKTALPVGRHGAKNGNASGTNIEDFVKKTLSIVWRLIKYAARGLALLFLFISTILSTLVRNFLMLFFIATNYQNRRHNILAEWTRWWRNLKENAIHLPLVTKILLSLSLILLLIFSGGIVYMVAKQKKAARISAYAAAIQNIKIKEDAAEGYLVYNDTSAAFASLTEAAQIIKNLSCFTALEKTNCKTLRDRLDSLLMKARKITLARPQLIADWNSLTQDAQINNIFLLNNKIYGFGQTSADILTYDPLVKESKIVSPGIFIKNFNAVSVPKENDYAVLLYDDKNIVKFNPKDNSWKKVDIDYPNQNVKIANISVYNRRLYSLDTQNGQVYKHDAIKTGFSLGKEWTKYKSDLSGIDLTIDGDVFVLGKNGVVYKFTNGAAQPFTITGLSPELTSADAIWTYNDLNYIYILDAADKRIIILEKTGQLKKQITAAEFTKPASMIIDEQKGDAYVLDSNKVYQIKL